MSLETANSRLDGEMGQVFYSELARHLFTARGTDKPGRINDTYFAGERQRRLDHSQEHMERFPAYWELPTFDCEELAFRTHTLSSHGIILLRHHFPLCETSIPHHIAPLACLKLQPPDFKLSKECENEKAEAQQQLAYSQLVLLVACNWSDTLDAMLPQLYGTLSTELAAQRSESWSSGILCWLRTFGLACSRGHKDALRCLLQFLVPEAVDMNGVWCQPQVIHSWGHRYNLLQAIATLGLQRQAWNVGDSSVDFLPSILHQLHASFANTELLMVEQLSLNPLWLVLESGDARLSELFMTWMGPSNVSRLVKISNPPESPYRGQNLLQAVARVIL